MLLSKVWYFLIFSPDIFLLDDPTSSLDNNVSQRIMNIINSDEFWNKRTFLITSNNLKLMKYFDKVIFMENGKVVHFKKPAEMRKEPHFKEISLEIEEETTSKIVEIILIFLRKRNPLQNRSILPRKTKRRGWHGNETEERESSS